MSVNASTETCETPIRFTPTSESNFYVMEELEGHVRQPIMESVLRPCLAEFLGVSLFVFVGTMVVQDNDVVAIGLCHGLTIAVLVAGFGHISGGHFNPAVTLGVMVAGGIKYWLGLIYIVAQVVGGVLGAACCRGVLGSEIVAQKNTSVYFTMQAGGHTLAEGVNVWQGMLCELLLTSILVSTVIMTAVDEEGKTGIAPLCIGLAVAADIFAGAKTTGASMNPARSFGPAVVYSYHDTSLWTYHYVYWVGPALGAILAGGLYRLMFSSYDKRIPRRSSRPF